MEVGARNEGDAGVEGLRVRGVEGVRMVGSVWGVLGRFGLCWRLTDTRVVGDEGV